MAPEMMIVTGNKDNTHWNLQDGYSNSVPTNETYPHRFKNIQIDLILVHNFT